jgi:ankyrin repeat protein
MINLDAKDHNGMTPLLVALSGGRGPIVEQLLADVRIDVNARTYCGLTSVHYAAANGSIGIFNQLLLVTNILPGTGRTSRAQIVHESVQSMGE